MLFLSSFTKLMILKTCYKVLHLIAYWSLMWLYTFFYYDRSNQRQLCLCEIWWKSAGELLGNVPKRSLYTPICNGITAQGAMQDHLCMCELIGSRRAGEGMFYEPSKQKLRPRATLIIAGYPPKSQYYSVTKLSWCKCLLRVTWCGRHSAERIM